MRKLSNEYIKKISAPERRELASILGCKSSTPATIGKALTSPLGLCRLLYSLTDVQYQVFLETAKDPSGITLGQLEIALHLKREELDDIVNALEKKLLAFVIKNRQHIHNKSDRLIAFADIREAFYPISPDQLQKIFHDLSVSAEKKTTRTQSPIGLKKSIHSLIEKIINSAGVISLKELADELSPAQLNFAIHYLLQHEIITIVHTPNPPFNAFLVATAKALEITKWDVRLLLKQSINRYNLLLNILAIHDIISTYGLFLTQQGTFRKIDIDRLVNALLPIEGIHGKKIPPHIVFQLCISLMHRCHLVEIRDDIVEASLEKVRPFLDVPYELLYALISINEPLSRLPIFESPISIPTKDDVKNLLDLIHQLKGSVARKIIFIATTQKLAAMNFEKLSHLSEIAKKQCETYTNALQFLHIIGTTTIESSGIALSDIGQSIASKLGIAIPTPPIHSDNKVVYINPDYTVLIPREELTSYEYYMLLSRMEIIKDDVMITAKITNHSILSAHKRGMNIEKFLAVLESLSKNPLPQNLLFMLKEWINHAIEVHIFSTILIKVNRPEFLDDLMVGKYKSAVVERLTSTVAIIDKSQLETLIKIARRKNSIIRLFS
ncbi:MAG: helicase-associated domain-containing protein [Spirochaetes bacterium]|nr:helicase-associated domain-containing protein [Spirochaetota bacterium]